MGSLCDQCSHEIPQGELIQCVDCKGEFCSDCCIIVQSRGGFVCDDCNSSPSTIALVERAVQSNILEQILHTCDLASGSNVNKCRYAAKAFFEDDLPKILEEWTTLTKQLEVAMVALEIQSNQMKIVSGASPKWMKGLCDASIDQAKVALQTIKSLSNKE